jgi:transposase
MSLPINIRIKIVLLMIKFESPIVVKRKLQVEFDKNTPSEVCIKEVFQRFCETGTVEDRERSGRPSKITEEKVDEVHDVYENEPQSSVRAVSTVCAIPRTIVHRTMTEYLPMKLYNV